MIKLKDNLENRCLFKVQMENRLRKGKENKDIRCYRNCEGYDIWCDNYTPLKQYNSNSLTYNLARSWNNG